MSTTSSGSGGGVSFASDIRPLFRESDRQAMQAAFDLWAIADVRAHGGGHCGPTPRRIDAVRWSLA